MVFVPYAAAGTRCPPGQLRRLSLGRLLKPPGGKGFRYAIRLPKNHALQESLAHLMMRAAGRRPANIGYYVPLSEG